MATFFISRSMAKIYHFLASINTSVRARSFFPDQCGEEFHDPDRPTLFLESRT
jgi:hypothetical protein